MAWVQNLSCWPSLQLLALPWEYSQYVFYHAAQRTERNYNLRFKHAEGTTVILCGMAIASLGSHCHAPTVMLTNVLATPIELSLIVPFLRFGEIISGGAHFPLTSDAFKKVLTGQASREVLLSIAHALLGWLVAAPLIFAALYILFLPCFKVLVPKFSTVPSSPKKALSPTEVRLKVASGQKKSMKV
ncbi:hypothetical protein Prudu_020959 [Prunus dulcis]|uniref:Uncharacterized protein n=1 Tax=Prunus dulcis TaxID=3755 RepID=A0A4Y1RWD2_PRUDU|nr:hypothetical protein Prudu_020959 [Prunus dulcis]